MNATAVAAGWAEGNRSLTPVRGPSCASVHHSPPYTITIVETKVVETRRVVKRETGVHDERDRNRDWKGESPGLDTFQSELIKMMPKEQLQVLQT